MNASLVTFKIANSLLNVRDLNIKMIFYDLLAKLFASCSTWMYFKIYFTWMNVCIKYIPNTLNRYNFVRVTKIIFEASKARITPCC